MAGINVSFVNTTTFTVATDLTTTFNTGRRVRITATSGYLYGTISSSSYSISNTTVILTAASDNLDSSISVVYYGIAADSIGSMPTHAHDSTEGEGGSLTLINLSDTPLAYDTGKFLQSTSSGTIWISGAAGTLVHSELSNLAYAASGHTGFSPTSHSHTESDISDLDKYTQSEVDTISGSLSTEIDSDITTHTSNSDAHHSESHTVASHSDTTATGANLNELVGSGDTVLHKHDTLYYTEAEVDTISGSLQTNIDADKSADEIVVEVINTPTYDSMQDWFNNTQSAGRMGGGDITSHTDAITDVTVSGAGYGEFKVSGDQTAYFPAALSIHITGSTNNNGYFTVSSGVVHSGGITTIPVDEAVAAIADGNIYNGRIDVAAGTGILKVTDSDIGVTKSFDLHAQTNITLTDIETNYVYVDYNAGNPNIQVTVDRSTIEKNRQFPLGMVYKNGPRTWCCSCGIYLPNRTRLDHDRILTLRGYERATGGEISEYGTRNIQSTAGIFFRGVQEIDTTGKASATDKLTTVYYDGSAWVWTENETQIDNTYYNNITTGLVELGSSKYAVHWVCIDYLSNLYVVYGRDSYSLAEAQLAGVPSLMPVVANEFGIVAAKIIIQKSAASFNELISTYTQLVPTATPAVHNNLSGLNDGDYKHLTVANHTDLTDGNVCTAHKHDISEDTSPDLGGQLGIGEYDIKFDSLLSADGKYSGETCNGILGDTLSFGDLVYLNTTDQRWEKADADAETTSGNVDLAIVLASGNDGDTRLLLTDGYVREDTWNFTSYGQALYIATISGIMTQTTVSGSGDIVRIVGYASTFADQIHFNPSKTWIELS